MLDGGAGTGGSVVRAARVRVAGDAVRIGDPAPDTSSAEPVVELVREDDTIQAIEITCSCGERINIRCDYA